MVPAAVLPRGRAAHRAPRRSTCSSSGRARASTCSGTGTATATRPGSGGPADALLELDGEERRPVPAELLALAPRVRRRVGLDLDPVDVTTDEGALRLRSFVWPGQPERMERLDRAIEAVRAEPPELRRGDIAEALPRLLAERDRDVMTLVFETAVLGYLGEERWAARRRQALAEAGRDGRLGVRLDRASRPRTCTRTGACGSSSGRAASPKLLAHADFHGAWLEWL